MLLVFDSDEASTILTHIYVSCIESCRCFWRSSESFQPFFALFVAALFILKMEYSIFFNPSYMA